MLLKSLSLHGFKTFADKTVLSFDSGITVVVGPNGSGKSNISDSIRWVLGEQSTRTLRCSKMEDVIFNGTPTKKAQSFAQVTLLIENKERKLDVDSDEVAITRRYHRSGESEYLINQTQVRLKDIHELFMDTGLGRDGYSIIGQGKIDSIVASKCEDRREIFEEAAGISRFRYRKADAEKRLSQAKENILRLEDVVKELESRLSPLKEQSQKAKMYLSLSEEKKDLEIGVWVNTIQKSANVIDQHKKNMSIAREQYDKIECDLSEIASKTEINFKKNNNCAAEIDKIQRKISSLEEESSAKKNKMSVLENDISHNQDNITRIKENIKESAASSEKMEQQIISKKNDIEKLRINISERQKNLDELTSQLESLQADMDSFLSDSDSLEKDISMLSSEMSDLKVKDMTSSATIDDLSLRVNEIDLKICSVQQKITDINHSVSEYKSKCSETQNKLHNLENDFSVIKNSLDSKKKESENLKNIADKFTLDSEDKIRRIRMLEELERNLEGFMYSVKTVLKESERGTLTGICGPVSRLIKVDEKYSAAISTALSHSMQNIVVQDESDAKKAIAFLKRKGAGRATFLPLSTIKGNKLSKDSFRDCKGFVGIASDLCACDSKYDNIVLYALGRVVVVESLDCAIDVSKKFESKIRIVTLDGQVVNPGGSLTGGSLAKGADLLSRTSEIKRMNDEFEVLKEKAKSSRIRFRENQDQISKLESELLNVQSKISIEKENLLKLSTEHKSFVVESENLAVTYQNLEKEKFDCQEKISKLQDDKSSVQIKINQISQKISSAKSLLEDKSKNKNDMFAKKEVLTEDIQKIHLQIFSDQKDISSFEYEIRTILERKEDSSKKISSLNDEIESIQNKIQSSLEEIQTLKQESIDIKELIRDGEKQIVDLKKERVSIEKDTTDLRNLERQKMNEREVVSREVSRLEERYDSLQKEYDVIIAKLWDEYELTKSEACKNYSAVENVAKANSRLNELKNKIKSLGNVNVGAIEEYKEVLERYNFMSDQMKDVKKSISELKDLINDLTSRMKEMFISKVNKINLNFKSIFKDLFGGGDAEILLSDPEDILNSGIEIEVQPPGKIVNRLEALSGGERSLIAIAIYFAIMLVNPPAFCVLDEIEAALDDVNVYRFASYLRKINSDTQFIAISHRRGTMEEADVLYGVTMQDEGISKLLKLDANKIEQKFKLL